jgi:phosphoglycolate phosphatase
LLALFDVDGTLLLTSDPLAGRALSATLEERYGIDLPENPVRRVDHPGQTCLRIARLVLRDAGLTDGVIDGGLAGWCGEFAARYVELLSDTDTSGWRAPAGAAGALARLSAAGITLALLTGNPEPMARARMERLGLGGRFPPVQGGFGCDAEERRALIDRAWERAGATVSETVAVGDTPRDVHSAQAAGIRVIVLRSPEHPAAGDEADAVCDTLDEVADLLLAWDGRPTAQG